MLLTPVQLLVGVGGDVVMGSRKPFGSPHQPRHHRHLQLTCDP